MPRGFPIFVLVFVVACGLAWGLLAYTETDREMRTQIDIAAPPERVWEVLSDTSQYIFWNPLIVRLEGVLAFDEKLAVSMKIPGGGIYEFQARVASVVPNRELRWRGGVPVPGFFTDEHRFVLEALPGGGTRLLHGAKFTGLLAGPLTAQVLDRLEGGLRAMNEALKAGCERSR